MKSVKKILIGALALCSVFAFMGCPDKAGEDMIKGTGLKFTMDKRNDTNDQTRCWRSTSKHNGAKCVFTIEDSENGSGKNMPGTMGLLFAFSKEDKTSYDFCIAGVAKNSADNNKWETYVSVYRNLNPANINDSNFGVATQNVTSDASAFLSMTVPCECEIKNFDNGHDGTFEAQAGTKNGTGKITVLVTQDAESGDYTVSFYNGETIIPNSTVTINGKLAGLRAGNAAESSEKAEFKRKLGVYANVYPHSYIKGAWDITNKNAGDTDLAAFEFIEFEEL